MIDLSIGTRILERYRIVRPLGQGGMGVVYLARTEGAAGFTRPVVIKRLHPGQSEDRELNEMFVREARILATLQHPNIVSVVDFGYEQHSYVMVLEYVHGYDLYQWLSATLSARRRLGHEYILWIVRKVLAALQHAHEVRLLDGSPGNIVHRDVSLSNVLLDVGGQVKLHDFGIARMDGGSEAPTAAGIFKGKLGMAAPELLRGRPATRLSDLYTTAVMTYQLLSGENPFKGSNEGETVFRILEYAPPPPSSLRDDLPPGLDEVLGRALEKEPSARFQTAAEFAEALEALSTRSDEAILRDFTQQLREDFAMIPVRLGLESLAAREAAWREAQDVPVNLQSTLSSSPPAASDPRGVDAGAPPQPFTAVHVSPRVLPATPTRSDRAPLLTTIGGVFGVGLVVLAVLSFALRRDSAERVPRYLVIESPGASAGDANATAASLPDRVVTPATTPSAAPRAAAAATRTKLSPVRPNAAALSQQFKVHQAEVESCFRRHAQKVAGRPQVSIRFEVDRTGKVGRTSLTPGSLESTDLGRCLLEVARAAHFGPLTEPVAFGIPITARVTERKD